MAKTDIAHISGKVVEWARIRAGHTHQTLAKALGKGYTAENVIAWEKEDAKPTFVQAENLAKKLRLPFGILFMAEPPVIKVSIPDLRTVSGQPPENPSINFFEAVSESQSRQRWYKENKKKEHAPNLPFVGRFKLGAPIETVAADLAKTLKITDDLRRQCNTWEKFLTEFIQRTEDGGILVMRSGYAKHSWMRGLDVDEFRGFALSDKLAPLVFINGADAKAAQIFTLAHELVHIWIGESGISNPDPRKRGQDYQNPIEKYCNAVAAEILIPAANLRAQWNNSVSADDNVSAISRFHRVSKIATAIRARELNQITSEQANTIIEAEYKRFREELAKLKAKAKEKEGGPGFWRGFTERVSARFSEAVFSALEGGDILFRDAASLLGVTLATLDKHPARASRT